MITILMFGYMHGLTLQPAICETDIPVMQMIMMHRFLYAGDRFRHRRNRNACRLTS